MPALLHDALSYAVAASLLATRELPIGSHISAPIKLSNGGIFGTLCCLSYKPKEGLGSRELSLLDLGARVISSILEAAGIRRDDYLTTERVVKNALRNRAIGIVYQPILKTGRSTDRCF